MEHLKEFFGGIFSVIITTIISGIIPLVYVEFKYPVNPGGYLFLIPGIVMLITLIVTYSLFYSKISKW